MSSRGWISYDKCRFDRLSEMMGFSSWGTIASRAEHVREWDIRRVGKFASPLGFGRY
jgi:hypothetical protein